MNESWPPSPELLAAYFDGEFEGRDDLVLLRRRLEEWLAREPTARAELAEYRRLRQVWQDTTPGEPTMGAWQKLAAHVGAAPRPTRTLTSGARVRRRTAAILALAACILLATMLFNEPPPVVRSLEPFPVASASEVIVLSIGGADTAAWVVGRLPVDGPLELVDPGEVALTRVEPDQRDSMVPDAQMDGPTRPIIWSRAEVEE